MSGFWGMRCRQVVSIAPSGVDPAYWCQCGARGLQINGLYSGVPPAGGTTSTVTKAEEKGPISRGIAAAVRG